MERNDEHTACVSVVDGWFRFFVQSIILLGRRRLGCADRVVGLLSMRPRRMEMRHWINVECQLKPRYAYPRELVLIAYSISSNIASII